MIELREQTSNGRTIVQLAGELDAAGTTAVEARLLELVQEGKKYLALDFAAVGFLASSGLRTLLVLARRVEKLEGRLVLCGLSPALRSTLEMTGFLPYFQTAASVEEALPLLA